MELCFMGTASAAPTHKRGVSCTALKYNGEVWLFDCGEGSQIQLGKSSVKFRRITKIFITHLHGDHVFGLPGLLASISFAMAYESSSPLEIYGPVGLAKLVRVCMGLSGIGKELSYKYVVHELVPDPKQTKGISMYDGGDQADNTALRWEAQGRRIARDEDGVWNILDTDQYTVKAGMLKHGIPSFGFVVAEKPLPGKLDAALLKELGVPPGPLYGELKHGRSVTTPSGQVVTADQVLGPARRGLKVTILGDTYGSQGMETIAEHSDVLVHETTFENALQEMALSKSHSTPAMAGAFARKIKAEKVVITHYSQRYHAIADAAQKPGEPNVQTLLDETKEAFWSDNVVAAEDLLELKVNRVDHQPMPAERPATTS